MRMKWRSGRKLAFSLSFSLSLSLCMFLSLSVSISTTLIILSYTLFYFWIFSFTIYNSILSFSFFFHNFREKFWNFKTKFKIFLTQIISKVDCVEFQSMKRRSWVILINYPPSLAIYLSSFLFPCPPCFPPLLCVLNTTSPSQIPHSLPNNLAQSFGVL